MQVRTIATDIFATCPNLSGCVCRGQTRVSVLPIMGIELKNKDGSKEAMDIGDSQSQGFSEGKLACVRLMKERARKGNKEFI